jgi:hypothetical protein
MNTRTVARNISGIVLAILSFMLLAPIICLLQRVVANVVGEIHVSGLFGDGSIGMLEALRGQASFLILPSALLVLGLPMAWAAYRLALSSRGTYRILTFCAALHGAVVLAALFALNHFRIVVPLEFWLALAFGWLLWPIVLTIHPQRSFAQAKVPLLVGLVFLAPCMSTLLFLTSHFRGYPTSLDAPAFVEGATNLGGGFRAVGLAEYEIGGICLIAHRSYLFDHDEKMADLDKALVAPSGRAVVYQEGASGNIFVFERSTGRTTQLTEKFPGLVSQFVWHEKDGRVSALVDSPNNPQVLDERWIDLVIRR